MSDHRPGEEDSENESDSELRGIGQQEVEEMEVTSVVCAADYGKMGSTII